MILRALLLCEDVRVEVDGTLTLIGVRNDRVLVRADDGMIQLSHLAILVVIGGLHGIDRIGFRERIRHAEDARPAERPLAFEAHDPRSDEHNFIFSHTPMLFPVVGPHDVIVDLEAGGESVTHRYRFRVERMAVPE